MAQENFVFGVAPCTNCGHMTRSGRMEARHAPGTRVRVGGGLCKECGKKPKVCETVSRPGVTAEMIARRDAATRSALEAYMRERAARIARWKRVVRL